MSQIKADITDGSSQGGGKSPVPATPSNRPEAQTNLKKTDTHYKLAGKNLKGIIIANGTFLMMSARKHVAEDIDKWKSALNAIGCPKVTVWEDLGKKELFNNIEEESSKDFSDHDGLVVVFMSHGDANPRATYIGSETLYAMDDEFESKKLWESFCDPQKCISLASKPKLFFIQACREDGLGMDTGVDGEVILPEDETKIEPYSIPSTADLLVAWAAYPGTKSIRSKEIKGAIWVHYLTEALKEHGSLDLLSLLTKVAGQVSDAQDNLKLKKEVQMPYFVSTLTRTLNFAKH